MNAPNPFAKAPAATPAVAPVVAAVADAAPDATAPAVPGGAKVNKNGEVRKKPAVRLTSEDKKIILDQYATKDTSIIAQELSKLNGNEVTRQQVYNCVRQTRKNIEDRIEAAKAANDQGSIAKLQAYVEAKLPHKEFGGGAAKGKGKSDIDSILDDILA
jgi:hypothetical protein